MKINDFLLEMYNEFFYCISWTKWRELQKTTTLVFVFSIFFSIFLYVIDKCFVFMIKKLFSI
ncbi:preprotein translocase subunit SecE [Blattabacterium cuenoti]|uniref:preprotein translocase subunit SecE n=1 Tax=Blattabacterium cuenoti TaxID=1653831 RepID=UPI00163CE259|nr:preprotein translocase subunit SecE [Blattabacterium cuenoti]